jgi:hypothetical protein
MFERKNQGVLAPHFSALVTHDGVVQDGDEDDGFLTLKERDHTLEAVGLGENAGEAEGEAGNDMAKLTSEEMLSKRKLKQGESRKAMLKLKSSGHKVIFDDAGGAHEMYEMQDLDDFAKQGDAEVQRQEYLAANREAMKEADVVDRQVAREKRQEKKRKRKDREREEVSREVEPYTPLVPPLLIGFDVYSSDWLNNKAATTKTMKRAEVDSESPWVDRPTDQVRNPIRTLMTTATTMAKRRHRAARQSGPGSTSVARRATAGTTKTKRLWLCGCYKGRLDRLNALLFLLSDPRRYERTQGGFL